MATPALNSSAGVAAPGKGREEERGPWKVWSVRPAK